MADTNNHNPGRRNFLKNSALIGAGLIIGVTAGRTMVTLTDEPLTEWALTPFIVIDRSGKITLVNPNPDMGQGSRQAVPTLIAEELEVALDQVTIVQSSGHTKYGVQISGGSGSVRRAWEPLRKAGAAAREILIKAAASRWRQEVKDCYASNGMVISRKTGLKIGYGDLIDLAATFEIPQNPTLKPPSEFKLIGKPGRHPDLTAKITGKAVYGIDIDVPDMVVACIQHSPTYHANVVSFDDRASRQIEGVLEVVKCERPMPHRTSEAVAVVATNFWSALQGRKFLKVQWEDRLNTDAGDYLDRMHAAAKLHGDIHTDKGNFDQHFATSRTSLEAVYETPFLAHAPMEPENATVHVRSDGIVDVWAPVQGPDWARNDVAKYLGIVPEKVNMNVTLSGGSFGRKAYHDYLLEACYLSRKLNKPVKVIWSREDDITQGPYRPALLSHFQGTVANGKLRGLHHHAIGESIDGQVHNNLTPGVPDPILCGEMEIRYDLEHIKISYSHVKTDIPIVWWRSVYASNFAFGQECFVDELAHLMHVDPLQARLDAFRDDRFIKVLQRLAEKSEYRNPTPEGMARGIAIWKSFESICATCVTISNATKGIRIRKVVSVIDCGIAVNPDMVRAQTEGNIIMGLGAAIKGGITLKNGVCEQTNFHQYHVLRMHETPEMEVFIMENEHPPGGVGEPGLPPVAPALGNAIYNLKGKRIRTLPIDLTLI